MLRNSPRVADLLRGQFLLGRRWVSAEVRDGLPDWGNVGSRY